MITIITPKLGLIKLSDADFEDYAIKRLEEVPLNFPVTDPTDVAVEAMRVTFHNALIKSINGTVADTKAKNTARRKLGIGLTNMANDCAKQANGDIDLYLTTGFGAREKGSPAGVLPAPENFILKAGANEGEMLTSWKRVPKSKSYQVKVGQDPDAADSWTTEQVVSASKATFAKLESGKKYYARVRAIGSKGLYGDWSDLSSKRCP